MSTAHFKEEEKSAGSEQPQSMNATHLCLAIAHAVDEFDSNLLISFIL